MDIAELKKLAHLARIVVSEEELKKLHKDMGAILKYVSQIQEVSSKSPAQMEHASGSALLNVMREDENPHASGVYSEELLREAPKTEDGYVKVKKIL